MPHYTLARLAEHTSPTHHSHNPSGIIKDYLSAPPTPASPSLTPLLSTVAGGNMQPIQWMFLEHLPLVVRGIVFLVPKGLKQLRR